jgi:hypothetical protein
MSREDQRAIGRDIAKVWFGWPIGFPARRPLAKGPQCIIGTQISDILDEA